MKNVTQLSHILYSDYTPCVQGLSFDYAKIYELKSFQIMPQISTCKSTKMYIINKFLMIYADFILLNLIIHYRIIYRRSIFRKIDMKR